MHLENKTIVVTGTNRGIGKALVTELLKRNVRKVYATARNIDHIESYGDARVVPLKLDITNEEQVKAVAKEASDTDLLINNAGAAEYISAMDGPPKMIERDMNTNYYGTLNMMRAFVPVLEKKSVSAIANVVSIVAFVNFPNLGGYCASKAALYSITQGARIELKHKCINVHSINPGPIDTDMAKGSDVDKTSPEETARNILDGLEADEADIFPDQIGRAMFDTWLKHYRDLEHMVASMLKSA
ncbi:SDR family oxidoreductase [Rubellicoccus peritrichatus]|uniref:SDR family oxidoreductase n=1 Tax=Rubellicoccus peritrichatus TaxID=3080537 RepID=A0AAQ3LEH1_9BACT|nr:SDR family oxidoreductase [Puniceicoccus sp. CR14]WOO42430.1 SDR family oxidoreductase [Puniceicoccus sp. CR14]